MTPILSGIDYEDVLETQETIDLAEEYLRQGVLSIKSRDDCRHIDILPPSMMMGGEVEK